MGQAVSPKQLQVPSARRRVPERCTSAGRQAAPEALRRRGVWGGMREQSTSGPCSRSPLTLLAHPHGHCSAVTQSCCCSRCSAVRQWRSTVASQPAPPRPVRELASPAMRAASWHHDASLLRRLQSTTAPHPRARCPPPPVADPRTVRCTTVSPRAFHTLGLLPPPPHLPCSFVPSLYPHRASMLNRLACHR